MKKTLTWIIVILLAVQWMTGCNSTDINEDNENNMAVEENASSEGSEESSEETEETAEMQEPVPIKIMFRDKQDSPFNPDWAIIKEIEKRGNVALEFEVVAEQQYNQKWQLAFNTGSAADIVTFVHPETMLPFAKNDLLVPISDYFDQMPNYQAYIADKGLAEEVSAKTINDGKSYWLQGFKEMAEYNAGILIRKDLVEAYGLEMPETVEDLAEVMKVFKENAPDSYPMTGFNGMDMLLALTSPYFGTFLGWVSPDATGYDVESDQYYNSYASEEGKYLVSYYSDLYNQEILDPELFTQNFEQWLQRLVTEQSFVTAGFAQTLPLINGTAQSMGLESFEMVLLPPLSSEVEEESKAILIRSMSSWVLPAKVAERDDFDRILEFLDWYLYSDEGIELQNWGIEGLTYEVVDGQKVNIDDKDTRINMYGVGTDSLSIVQDMASIEANTDPVLMEMTKALYDADRVFGSVKMQDYTEDETEEVGILASTLKDLGSRYYQQFIMDVMDVDTDWDTFISEVENAGSERLLEIKND